MDDKPEQRPPRPAKKKATKALNTSSILNPDTKKRSAASHEHSGRSQKARKTKPSKMKPSTPSVSSASSTSPASPPHVEEGAENEKGAMEVQITAETRGVTRKNIPWDTFHSIYLCDFSKTAQPKLTVKLVKKIGKGDWEEKIFWGRLRKTLSDEVLHDLKLFYGGIKTLYDANKGEEGASKFDFVLHVGEEHPMWADVELLFAHTRSRGQETVTKKFLQWLRNAWSVFHHQPFRLHLYGIMFIRPCADVCYADHGCAVYSEPLDFVENNQHAQFLVDFLTGFISNPVHRGRDPTVTVDEWDRVQIRHAGTTLAEAPNNLLYYRPSLTGRNIRVALVLDKEAKLSRNKMVMKSTWEEKVPPASSTMSEVEVLKTLLKANVRGLPQPYALDSATVRDDGDLEVETRSFPENCEVALLASTNSMVELQASYVAPHPSKHLAPGANIGDPLLKARIQKQQFNEPLNVRRRLTRVLMSYCVPLKEAMRYCGPNSLLRTIRDAMIVYYEAYKLPESGFLHGDISIENILVPMEGCVLTEGLTYKDRRGTLIDWNFCFNARGESSNRSFRSITPVFVAPVLLQDKQIPRRTLSHDMESFFAVIIWMATFDHYNEAAFEAKPLAKTLLDQKAAPIHIANSKDSWFKDPEVFQEQIIDHLEAHYRKDKEFVKCINRLRKMLYPIRLDLDDDLDKNDNEEMGDADPMKEGLFRQCMKEIDDYLQETKGCSEMQWIDSNALAQSIPESR